MSNNLHRAKPLLGTFVEVSVQDTVSDKSLITQSNAAFKQIEQIESLMSFHNQDSELSKINRHAYKQPMLISDDMATVIKQAIELSRLTAGVFDITIAPELISANLLPEYHYAYEAKASWQDIILVDNHLFFERPLIIDLGGIAKGYAVDQAVSAVDEDCKVIVNAGGDLSMSHWHNEQVSIRVPNSTTGQTVDIAMQAASIATSGHYFLEGNIAIINALTKEKADENISVSVFSNSCMLADALTKVAFLYKESDAVLSNFRATSLRLNSKGEVLI